VYARDAMTSVQPVFILACKQRAAGHSNNEKNIRRRDRLCLFGHISGVVCSAYMRPNNSSNARRRPRPSFLPISRPVRS
jgi:hypothetical protein